MSDNLIENKASLNLKNEFEDILDTKSVLKEKPVLNSDKIQVHEFTRENIIPSFDDSVDHFTFKSENDIKYDFLQPKYFFSLVFCLK